MTTFEEIQGEIRKFCEDRDWDQFHGAKELAIGVITEAAELLDHFRFLSTDEVELLFTRADARRSIESEVADVLIFLLRLVDRYDIDLEAVVRKKLLENAERYPVELVRGSNAKVPRPDR